MFGSKWYCQSGTVRIQSRFCERLISIGMRMSFDEWVYGKVEMV